MRLVACRSCQRHLKPDDTACPFCGAATRSVVPLVATAAVGLAMATAGIAACETYVPIYGTPPIQDAGATDAGFTDAGS